MAIKQLSNIVDTGNISHVCSVHIKSRGITESFQEPQDAEDTQDINRHKLSAQNLYTTM